MKGKGHGSVDRRKSRKRGREYDLQLNSVFIIWRKGQHSRIKKFKVRPEAQAYLGKEGKDARRGVLAKGRSPTAQNRLERQLTSHE